MTQACITFIWFIVDIHEQHVFSERSRCKLNGLRMHCPTSNWVIFWPCQKRFLSLREWFTALKNEAITSTSMRHFKTVTSKSRGNELADLTVILRLWWLTMAAVHQHVTVTPFVDAYFSSCYPSALTGHWQYDLFKHPERVTDSDRPRAIMC